MIIPNQLLSMLLLLLEIKLNVIVMDDKLQQLILLYIWDIFFRQNIETLHLPTYSDEKKQDKNYMNLRNYHFHFVTLCAQPDPNDYLILLIYD